MLTREEIEQLPAGKEMDAAVAEHVLGHIWLHNKRYGFLRTEEDADLIVEDGSGTYGKHPEGHWIGPDDKYSTDIAATWQLVEQLNPRQHALRLTYGIWRENGEKQVGWRADFGPFGASSKTCETAPHAICLAALALSENGPALPIEKETKP